MQNIVLSTQNIDELIEDIADAVVKKIQMIILTAQNQDRWFDLNKLIEYDPEKRTKPTFYRYVHNRTIPFHKKGRKLIFLKSEIDDWLKAGRVKTGSEIKNEIDNITFMKG